MPRGEAHDGQETVTNPPVEQNPDSGVSLDPEKTGREHPNPPDSPKNQNPPEPAPEPEPEPEIEPRRKNGPNSLTINTLHILDRAIKSVPYHHLWTNDGKLVTSGEWLERWRNTRFAILSGVAIAVGVWNRPDVVESRNTAVSIVHLAIGGWAGSHNVHNFYHKHDVEEWSSYWSKRGDITAHWAMDPDRLSQGHRVRPYNELSGAAKWDGVERPLNVTFPRGADWRDLILGFKFSDTDAPITYDETVYDSHT